MGPQIIFGLKQVIFLSDYVHEAHHHTVSIVDLEALLRFLNLDVSGTFLATTCDLWHISIYLKTLFVGRLQIVN